MPDLVQIRNPRTGGFTVVDRAAGTIVGHEPEALPDVVEVREPAPGPDPRPDFVVDVDVYHCQLGVFLCKDDLQAWFDERELDATVKGANACAFYCVDPDGIAWHVAFVPEDAPWPLVGHEMLHAAWYMLESAGVEVTADNHEALAYLQMHLSKQVWSALHPEAETNAEEAAADA